MATAQSADTFNAAEKQIIQHALSMKAASIKRAMSAQVSTSAMYQALAADMKAVVDLSARFV